MYVLGQEWGGGQLTGLWGRVSGREEVQAEERISSLENVGRKVKEKNRTVMVMVLLIKINNHKGTGIVNSYPGSGDV